MTITYDATENEIHINGETVSFEDIYNASQTNGWGVVEKQGQRQYRLTAKIVLGDTSPAILSDTDVQILFENVITGTNEKVITIYGGSKLELEDADIICDAPSGNYPVLLIYGTDTDTSYVVFRDVSLKLTEEKGYVSNVNADFERVVFARKISPSTFSGKLHRCTIADTDYAMIRPLNPDIDDVLIRNCKYGFYGGGEVTYKNVKMIDTISHCFQYVANGNVYIVDCEWDKNAFSGAGDTGYYYYIQYTVQVRVKDKDGNWVKDAIVKIYNKNGELVALEYTDANGETPIMTVTRNLYDKDGNETPYYPFRIEVEKDGMTKYVIKNLDIDRKLRLVVALDSQVYEYDDVMREIKRVKNLILTKI